MTKKTIPLPYALKTAMVVFLLLLKTIGYARHYSVIHYDQSNGFPASYGYITYQDHDGYIWISTENGLARFNGYEFKLYTTKDGLPDNEIFNMREDGSGRLWFCPFANSIGYIKNGKVYNKDNDPLLRQLHFNIWPENILFDRYGNIFISEGTTVTCLSGQGKIRFVNRFSNAGGIGMSLSDSGKLRVQCMLKVYEFEDSCYRKVRGIPDLGSNSKRMLLEHFLSFMSWQKALAFVNKAIATGLPFYNDYENLLTFHVVLPISAQSVVITRKDGCYLADIATANITDTLLTGNTAACLLSPDSSLWIGTHGNGMYRFINSPVKSFNPLKERSSVLYLKAQQNGMYCLLERGLFTSGTFNRDGILQTTPVQHLNKDESYQVYVYLGQDSYGNWISCAGNISKRIKIGANPDLEQSTGYCKQVIEDGAYLLAATGLHLLRLKKDNINVFDTLVESRVTSVAKCGDTIYTGTLNGLLAGTGPGTFHKVFSSVPALSGHIVKLCTEAGNTLWVANNNAILTAVNGDKVIATIDDKSGLQCNRISALKASSAFIWVGTDNGLYAVQNAPPYAVVRHLTYTTGLNSNQVNCLDVNNGTVWVGTTNGINYFDEQDVFRQLPGSKLIINNITNGNKDVTADSGIIELSQKMLAVDFDVIDLAGGQRPGFQYRLNGDSNWTRLENSNLYFPDVPYGNFTISIRAQSPNWKGGVSYKQLLFYRPYPFYFRWWFVAMVSLVFAGAITGSVVLFIRRVRRKDHEKLSVERNLLQLEQMALQGQMNPHFIFNCIAAIKQYYNSGDTQKANGFVDVFASLIRQTFEMGTETFIPLNKELEYLTQYLAVEQVRFDHTFDFSITKKLSLPESEIPVPAMLLQPLAENAVRHGIRHLSGRRGAIEISVQQAGGRIEIVISDNGVGREKSRRYGYIFQDIMRVTSTTVNTKRIEILNRLFEKQIIHKTEDIINATGETTGTRVTISYPLAIQYPHH